MKNNMSIQGQKRIAIYYPHQDNYSLMLGRVSYLKANPPLVQHIHKEMIEIVLIVKGRQIYTVGDCDYIVNSGEVFVTFANELHSTANSPQDKSLLYYMIINIEELKTFYLGCDVEDGGLISYYLNNIQKRVFKASEDLKSILDGIITAYYSNSPFKTTIIRNLVSSFIINVINCEKASKAGYNHVLQNVLDYIEQNIYQDLSVSDLAKISGLSLARFKTNFRKQTGIPPREFVLRRKIETAMGMLENSDITITELAHSLSFSSSQYFSTVFKRFTLMSPNECRNQKRNANPSEKMSLTPK